eukprot:TRINITY_DN33384_c0_g1_i1.p1 TRINITY_DN33384_c0_g1~~TRINITY_DN33384_c0_g1_i1.p1  ORF type:complete len:722 (-),score=158.96 TRINITY_DN33384_c0_g1_i1:107-2272(-)
MCLLKGIRWVSQDTVSLQNLRLHPLHLDSSAVNGLTALPARDAWDALVEYGQGEESASMSAMIAAKCNSSQEHIQKLQRIHLSIHCSTGVLRISEGGREKGATVRFEIPLLFVEIGCGYDPVTGVPVLVITDPLSGGSLKTMLNKKEAPSNSWLFPVQVNDNSNPDAIALAAMAALGKHGAATNGFETIYRVDPHPTMKCPKSYLVMNREDEENDRHRGRNRDPCSSQDGQQLVKFVPCAGASAAATEETAAVRREVSMLVAAQGHPNVSNFFGLFTCDTPMDCSALGPKCWGIITETCDTDLFEEATRKPLNESRAREVTYGLLSALEHIHERGLVHRDVKPENILLAPCGRTVLSSFGIATRITERQEIASRCGSQSYVAPEVLLSVESQCGTKMDIFGLGATLYFALCGKVLFNGSTLASICKRTVKCKVEFVHECFAELSAACLEFVRNLLLRHPRDRPCATEALSSFWVCRGDSSKGVCLRGDMGSGVRNRRRSNNTNGTSDNALRRLMSRSIAVSDSEFDIASQSNAYASICSTTTVDVDRGGAAASIGQGSIGQGIGSGSIGQGLTGGPPVEPMHVADPAGNDAASRASAGDMSVEALKKELEALKAQKAEAVGNEDYVQAQKYKELITKVSLALSSAEEEREGAAMGVAALGSNLDDVTVNGDASLRPLPPPTAPPVAKAQAPAPRARQFNMPGGPGSGSQGSRGLMEDHMDG